jgi:hypothetical protein
MPFEPYAPVRQQLFNLLWMVNQQRKAIVLDLVPNRAIRYRRRIVRPFEPLPADDRPDELAEYEQPDMAPDNPGQHNSGNTQLRPKRSMPPRPKLDDDFLKQLWPYVEKSQP